MTDWTRALDLMVRDSAGGDPGEIRFDTPVIDGWTGEQIGWMRGFTFIQGPEDDFEPEVNGDPDSLTGEEDTSGFDEMSGWPDESDDEEGEEDGEEIED